MRVVPGIERVIADPPKSLTASGVGLITNHSAVTRDLTHTADALASAGICVAALFGPEHGIRGDLREGELVDGSLDPSSGTPVFSLYGAVMKPTAEMLRGLDVILFDIQDIGSRFYTYIWTMAYAMEACAEFHVPFVVLDRPNPITGRPAGPMLESEFRSFVGLYPIPTRHGLTTGELALYLNGEFGIGADVDVIACEGLQREMWFDECGLPWVPPSPNMPTPETALMYSGSCIIEGTNLSEGRGTCKPFEVVGAPWIDAYALAERLSSLHLPGIGFRPTWFIPWASKYKGERCAGVQAHALDRDRIEPVSAWVHVVRAVHDMYPDSFRFREPDATGKSFFDKLMGTASVRETILGHLPMDELISSWYDGLSLYTTVANRYRLY